MMPDDTTRPRSRTTPLGTPDMSDSDPRTSIASLPIEDQPAFPSSSSQPSSSLDVLLTHHVYAQSHILQSYDLYMPPSPASAPEKQKPWLIFLHGGAWRDPTITAPSFLLPTLQRLLNQPPHSHFTLSSPRFPSLADCFAGIASLSYRLSPHPSYPQPPPPETSASEYRNARHPDHISDVLTGVGVLQKNYGFGGSYVVVGHSCGGMMGLQVAMKRWWKGAAEEGGESGKGDVVEIEPPMAIISLCGTYDLPLLVSTHEDVPAYRAFVTGAFGEDEKVWGEVSPARWNRYAQSWRSGPRPRVAVLAYAKHDELVDRAQVQGMEAALRAQQRAQLQKDGGEDGAEEGNAQIKVNVLELKGSHDEVWQDGREVVRAIEVAMDMLGM